MKLLNIYSHWNIFTFEVWEWIKNSSHIFNECNYLSMLEFHLIRVNIRGTYSRTLLLQKLFTCNVICYGLVLVDVTHIQLSTVITRPILPTYMYYIRHYDDSSKLTITTATPYLPLTDQLWVSIYFEDLGENEPRYNATALYLKVISRALGSIE